MAIRTSRDDGEELHEQHEINVTPFIDVMLVLLIIFMVAAPLATVDISVDLPASAAQRQPLDVDPVYLTVQADRQLLVNEQRVARDSLAAVLDGATGGNRDERIFLRADTSVPYGELMGTMNALLDAGYTRVALVGLELSPE